MPKQPPTLGTTQQAGVPRIGRDEPSMNDLVVWQFVDSHTFNGGNLPNYLDLYPGIVNPDDGSTLYANFFCIDRQPTEDNRYWNIAWQGLPGTMLYERQMSEEAQGQFVTIRRQIVAHGTAQQALTPNTIGYDDKDIDPGRILRTSMIADSFPVKAEFIYDNERGNVLRTRQLIPITGSESATDVLVGDVVIKTQYQPYDKNLLDNWVVIESFIVPGPTRGGLKKSPQAEGTLVQVEDSIQPYNVASLVPDFGLLEYSDYQTDGATLNRHAVYVFSFPTLTEVYYQMELNGRRVVKQYTIVPILDASEFASPGSSIEYRKIDDDAFRKIQIYTVWDSVTPFTERRLAAYNFPNLFDATIYFWSDACGAFGNMEADRNYLTFIYTKHETFTSLPTEQVYLMLRPRTHMVGRGWQPFIATLNDEFIFSYSGACTEAFTFVASDPDLTTYLGLTQSSNPWSPGGVTPQIIAEECTLGEDLFYHRITHKIVPQ